MSLPMTCARLLEEAGRAELLEAAQPLANRGGEQAGRGLDAALLGALDQTQAMVVDGPFHLTHQIEKRAVVTMARRFYPRAARLSQPGSHLQTCFSLKHFNFAKGIRCDRAIPARDCT